ncbi:hypothetical protein GCM10010156_65730 [Planobispora rosea]|uniref:Uncharacterized protein n=1 Tax=Planobispora rosea TaxID=35762 RepID=A0A8J3WFZ8_PLARO|nr:hypothetical protein GCM10010156_65730 [Planobispora rosea]GIH87888.1 hypothetical protein Pro02_62960 [Planobispora rosea]
MRSGVGGDLEGRHPEADSDGPAVLDMAEWNEPWRRDFADINWALNDNRPAADRRAANAPVAGQIAAEARK